METELIESIKQLRESLRMTDFMVFAVYFKVFCIDTWARR